MNKKYYDRFAVMDSSIAEFIKRGGNIQGADVVEVVRCKDCEWYREGNHFLAPTKFCYRLKDSDGKNMAYNMSEMDYCSYGRRKEDEG